MTMMIPTREQSPQLTAPARRPMRPSPMASGITPRDIWRIVLKRKWMIILSFVVCVAIMGTVTLLWWKYAKGYVAEAFLTVTPPPVSMMHISPQYTKEVVERNKMSQAALVKHQPVLRGAADAMEEKDSSTPIGRWYSKNRNNIEQILENRIKISLGAGTNDIRLSMAGTDREILAGVVNAMAQSFVSYTKKNSSDARMGPINTLQSKKDELEKRRENILKEIAAFKRDPFLVGMEGRRSTIATKKLVLTREIHQAEMDSSLATTAMRTYSERLEAYKRLEAHQGKEGDEEKSIANDPQIRQMVDFNPMIRGLETQLAGLETALHNAIQKFGEKHRQVQEIRGMIEAVKKQIEDKTKEEIATQVTAMGQMRWLAEESAKASMVDLTRRLQDVDSDAKDLENKLSKIESRQQELVNIRLKLERFDARLDDLRMLGGVKVGEEAAGPVTIHSRAQIPREDDWKQPRVSILMPLGAVLGLLVGFGLAFLLEFMDTSVKSPSDLARKIDLPLLGMVPHADDLDDDVSDFRRVALLAPHSPASEAFRQIRANLLFSGPEQKRRSLLVTSPAPQDGRTTVVTNLAISVAQSGRKVLLVDANFHRPAIAEMFSGVSEKGLSSALVGQSAWRDVVSATDVPNLSVMSSGPLPPNPADLLGSEMMEKIISEMTGEYDQVIFDGSPLMVVADSCVLGTKVDGVVLVVRAGVSSTGIVQRSSERLSRVGAHVFGVVLQGVRSTAGGYLRKNYETFYEYHQKSIT